MIIAIDFDGTLVEHNYPDIGPELPRAFQYLKEFQEAGAKLILWTMRSDGQKEGNVLTDAVEFCRERGVEFWGVNENPQQDWSDSPKAYCQLYIDDRGFGCPLTTGIRYGRHVVDWEQVGPIVLDMIKNWRN